MFSRHTGRSCLFLFSVFWVTGGRVGHAVPNHHAEAAFRSRWYARDRVARPLRKHMEGNPAVRLLETLDRAESLAAAFTAELTDRACQSAKVNVAASEIDDGDVSHVAETPVASENPPPKEEENPGDRIHRTSRRKSPRLRQLPRLPRHLRKVSPSQRQAPRLRR